MKTEVIDKSPTNKEVKIEIPADVVKEAYGRTCARYRNSATLPGFRKGMAPMPQVIAKYKEDIKNDVVREVIGGNIQTAIAETGLKPLADPQVHFDDFDGMNVDGSEPIKVHVHVEVMGEVPAPEYKGIEVARRVRPVPADDADKVIDDLRKRGAAMLPVEGRKSETGDTVTVDLVGTFVGEEGAEPIKAEGIEIAIGDENIEKSFSENLVGLGEDEEKEFTVTYAPDFGSADLAGKTVKYLAKVKSIGRVELPEADDEWAKSLEGEYQGMKDLRDKIVKDMEAMAKADADARVRNEIVNELIKKHEFEVPGVFIENQAYNLLNKWAQDLAQRGMDPKNIDKQFMQMVYTQMRPQAELDVRGSLLLEKVAEIEKVEVTEEDLNEEILRIANYYRVPTDDVRASLAADGGGDNLKHQLKTRKTIEVIVTHAKITDEPWVEESEEPVPVDMEQKKAKKEPKAASEKKEDGEEKPAEKKAAKKKE